MKTEEHNTANRRALDGKILEHQTGKWVNIRRKMSWRTLEGKMGSIIRQNGEHQPAKWGPLEGKMRVLNSKTGTLGGKWVH